MAPLPDNMLPSIEDAFIADRVTFWASFTSFAKYSVAAIVVLLILMWLFLA